MGKLIERFDQCKDCGSPSKTPDICADCGGDVMSVRYFPSVLELMLENVPATADTLRLDLGRLKRDSMFTAPEIMGNRWNIGAKILQDHFGNREPTEGWQKTVTDIYMDRAEVNAK